MKSKMKSTFAIIAVALMVLVAVVPMVGVFTSESDAAIVVDPSTDTDDIAVTVVLYDAAGAASATATGYKIKITYGSYSQTGTIASTSASTGITFHLREASVASAVISYVDADGVQDDNYPAVTLSDLVKGKTYNAALKAGMASKSVKFSFKSGGDINATVLGNSAVMSGTYEVYATNEATEYVSSGSFVMNGYVGTFYYPYTTNANVYVAVTSFSTSIAVTFDNTAKQTVVLSANDSALKAKEDLITITPVNTVKSEITISSFIQTNTPTGGTGTDTTFQPIKNTMIYKGTAAEPAYFFGIMGSTTGATNVYTMTLSADSSSMTTTAATFNTTSISYSPAGAIFGTVGMAIPSTSSTQAGTLTVKLGASATATTDLTTVTATVDSNGNYFKYVETTATYIVKTDADKPVFVSGSKTFYPTTSSTTYAGNTAIVFAVPTTDYSEVSGVLTLNGGTDKYIVGKELIITGADTFGSLETKTNGVFSFAAETGKTIVISVSGADLSGKVSAVVGSGSSGAGSKNLAIEMSTQVASIKLSDAMGNNIAENVTVKMIDAKKQDIQTTATNGILAYDSDTKTYKASVRADLDLSAYKVYFTSSVYGFDAKDDTKAVAYVKDSTYTSTNGAFKLQITQADGTPITAQDSQITIGYATAYKNSAGSIVYDTTGSSITPAVSTPTYGKVNPTDVSNTLYKFLANKTVIQTAESAITTTPIDVVYVQITGDATTSLGIFKNIYMVTADSDGFAQIVASVDSFTAKLVRNDKVTPVAGIKAQLVYYNNTTKTTMGDVTYTQTDGSFTVYSNKLLSGLDAPQIEFTNGSGYTFTAPAKTNAPYPVYKSVGVLNTTFMPATDAYTFTFVDADGAKINLHETDYTYSSTITGSEAAVTTTTVGDGNTMTASVKWTKEQDLSVTLTHKAGAAAATTYRTFSVQSLDEDGIADGDVTLVSNQAKYTFKTVDADGKKYGGATISLYKYVGDQDILIEGTTVTINNTPTSPFYGTGSILLPLVSETDVDTVYGYRATGGGDYMYDLTTTVIDDTEIIVESYSNKVVVYLEDEAGNALAYQPTGVTIYDGSVAYPATVTLAVGYFSFVGDSDTNYSYTITMAGATHYTFKEKSKAIDGAVKAKEQVVYGTLSDANGMKLPLAGDVTIQAYDAYGVATGASDTYTNASSNFRLIVSTAEAATYRATFVGDDAVFYGAYVESLTTVITTDEEFVGFSAVTANGVGLENATITGLSAYDENNSAIGKSKTIDGKEYLFVEEDEVVYYKATTINDGDPDFAFTFDKESLTNVFVANESYITGSVPYSGKGTGKVVLDLYLLGDLVKEVPGYIANTNKYEYEAILDLSDYTPIDGTAGVAFDSIVAVYSEGGVVIAASPVNPYTTVNNVISPTIESFEIKLDAPSALVARHVSMARVGNTATVSADAKFIVSDDEAIYTDGQYIYTFAGWYVDNELVSHNAVFTFTATEDVVIAPAYTVAYEKISDANAQVDPEIIIEEITKENTGIDTNVLIIGIAAVIVALIAVVYAVIKKE